MGSEAGPGNARWACSNEIAGFSYFCLYECCMLGSIRGKEKTIAAEGMHHSRKAALSLPLRTLQG